MRVRSIATLFACAAIANCALSHASPPAAFTIEAAANDAGRATVENDARLARARIEAFFGARFREPVRIVISPSRIAFDAALPASWQIAPSQCWMVGVGVADRLEILSPAAWMRDACEHDSADAQHVQDIVTHELTHAFHGQQNPTRDFTGMDDMGWFVEGLAVLVADQMDHGHMLSAADAIAAGAAPTSLAQAWSGRYRYGVCGSMVAFIDHTYGRRTLVALLAATSQQDILNRLQLSEHDFLTRWRAWATRPAASP